MTYMNVHASLFPYIYGYECLYYALVCMFLSYDLVSTYVMFNRLRIKETQFGNLYFSYPLKLNLCMFTVFLIKPEVAGTMTMAY